MDFILVVADCSCACLLLEFAFLFRRSLLRRYYYHLFVLCTLFGHAWEEYKGHHQPRPLKNQGLCSLNSKLIQYCDHLIIFILTAHVGCSHCEFFASFEGFHFGKSSRSSQDSESSQQAWESNSESPFHLSYKTNDYAYSLNLSVVPFFS